MKQVQTEKQNILKQEEMPEVRKSEVDNIFTLVKKDGKVKIACGNYQISREEFNNFKAAERYLASKPYEIIINVTCLFTKLNNKKK